MRKSSLSPCIVAIGCLLSVAALFQCPKAPTLIQFIYSIIEEIFLMSSFLTISKLIFEGSCIKLGHEVAVIYTGLFI